MIDPAFSKKCFVILTNEVLPRAKKLNMSVGEFYDVSLLGYLARLEFDGHITRKDLREILDYRVKDLQNNADV